MSDCPEDLVLAEIASGATPPSRDEVLVHAADCPSCRAALADFAGLDRFAEPALSPAGQRAAMQRVAGGPAGRALPWIPLAAAAALLLALVPLPRLLRHPAGEEARPGDGPSPGPVPRFASARAGELEAESSDLSMLLGRSGALALRAGSRARILPDGSLSLIEGTLWLESPGEAMKVAVDGSLVTLECGVILLEPAVPAGKAAGLWVREARAGASGTRLVAVSGSAVVSGSGRPDVTLHAGEALVLGQAQALPVDLGRLGWRGDAGWRRWDGLPIRIREGSQVLSPKGLGGDYAWEACFRRADPSAAVAVCFEALGHGWQVPVGGPLGEAKAWLRVRVESRGGWVRVQTGSYEILKERVATLGRRLDMGEGGCGLRAWGGDLEVVEARWRTGG